MNRIAAVGDRLATPAKPACPFCRSQHVTTTSKSVTEGTYWRCGNCGEIWNQARLLTFHRRR